MNYDIFKQKNIKFKNDTGILTLCFFVIATVALTETYANPLLKEIPSADSSVYLAMAWFKQKGFVLYKDFFDHKGPLLYLINDLFAYGKNNWTIWIFEIISLFTTSVLIYKTLNIFFEKRVAFISTTYAILIFGTLIGGGNDIEEYGLLFICIGLYIFTDVLYNKKEISWFQAILIGVSCGAVLMLRPNMTSVWLGFGPGLFIYYIINKNTKQAVRLSVGFIVGVAIIVLPFMLYFIQHNALHDFYDAYWVFNMQYSKTSIKQIISSEWSMLIKLQEYNGLVSILLLCFMYVINIFLCKKQNMNKFYSWCFLLYIFFQLILVDMSGKGYEHYYICLIPVLAMGFAILINMIWKQVKKHTNSFKNQIILLGMLLIILSGILIPRTGLFIVKRIREIDNPEHSTVELQQIAEYVQNNTEEKDEILCLGAGLGYSSVYWSAERLPSSRYFFTPPSEGSLKDNIFNIIQNDIDENKPAIIIKNAQNKYLNEINLKQYQLIKEYGNNQIYIGVNGVE